MGASAAGKTSAKFGDAPRDGGSCSLRGKCVVLAAVNSRLGHLDVSKCAWPLAAGGQPER